ncbi:MAG: DUF371 domain-containing protein [Candidatus Helarchaeota archaeon]
MVEKVIEEFFVKGHPNILGKHKTTIEFTKDNTLTKKGDCIIGVSSEKGLNDFKSSFKKLAKHKNSRIICKLILDNYSELIEGKGAPNLTFNNKEDIVIRKSNFICDRTIMIGANKSAIDIDRRLIKLLQNSDTRMKVVFEVSF